MNGQLYFVTTDETATTSDDIYYAVIASALNNAINKYGSQNVVIDAFQISPSSAAEKLGRNLETTPSVFLQFEGNTTVFLVQGRRTATDLEQFFTNALTGNTKDKGGTSDKDNGGTSDKDNGGTGSFGLPMRPCIPWLDHPIDAFLDWIGAAKYKKEVLLGGAGVLTWCAFNATKRVGQFGYGGGAAAVAWLALAPMDPKEPCAPPTPKANTTQTNGR